MLLGFSLEKKIPPSLSIQTAAFFDTPLTFENLKGTSSNSELQTIAFSLESGAKANLHNVTFKEGALNGKVGIGLRILGGSSQSHLKTYRFDNDSFKNSESAIGIQVHSGANIFFENLSFKSISTKNDEGETYRIYIDDQSNSSPIRLAGEGGSLKFEHLGGTKTYVFHNKNSTVEIDNLFISYADSESSNQKAGINNEKSRAKYYFGETTNFISIVNLNGNSYGIKDSSTDSQHTFDGILRFQKIFSTHRSVGLDFERSWQGRLDFKMGSTLIFDLIEGVNSTGIKFGGDPQQSIDLKGTKWALNIKGSKKEIGLDLKESLSLQNKALLFVTLNGSAQDSHIFLGNFSKEKNISLDDSTLALELNNPHSKISEQASSLSGTLTLSLKNGSKLILGASKRTSDADLGTIDTLQSIGSNKSRHNIVDLANSAEVNMANGEITSRELYDAQKRSYYKMITIGDTKKSSSKGLQGNHLTFRLYVNGDGGDKLKVTQADTKSGNQQHYLEVAFSKSELPDLATIDFKKDIILVELKKDYKDTVLFTGLNSSSYLKNKNQLEVSEGFSSFIVDIQNKYDSEQNWYEYYIPGGAKLISQGLRGTYVQTGIQANLSTYGIFTANFNSLNKRMGELRNDDNAYGIWFRAYHGQQNMHFATGSKINYTSFQLGSDANLDFRDSRLYLGAALNYSFGKSKFNNVRTHERSASVLNASALKSLDLAFYASYIEDIENGGFYSDSIAKISYIINHLSTTGNDTYNVNAIGASFSQEFGYRTKFASGFFIDPQAEVSYGYLGEQNFTQVYTDRATQYTEKADFAQEQIHTLRSRVGVNLGIDFKNFFEKYSKANFKIYLGTYFVYDYIQKGKITIDNLDPIKQRHILYVTPYQSTGRAVLNLGTNLSFKDGTKLYFDFERSFGGKIVTEYQFNLGLRVSFGDKLKKEVTMDAVLKPKIIKPKTKVKTEEDATPQPTNSETPTQ